MSWQVLAVIGPVFFVAYQAFSKLLPKETSVFLINMYVYLAGAIVMLAIYFLTSETKSLAMSPKHFPLLVTIGALIAFGNVAIIKAYTLGATQSGFTALFYSLLIVYGIVAGLIIWREKFSLVQGLGVLFILGGIFMVTIMRK